MNDKPFHLMTPAERTVNRIAQNKAITEKIALSSLTPVAVKPKRPPAASTKEFIRETPEERAGRRAGVIRKIES